jgi:hypothetical protein
MLNIITKPKIETIQISSTLMKSGLSFYLPRSFDGYRFRLEWSDDKVRLVSSPDGIKFQLPKGKMGDAFKRGTVTYTKLPFKKFRSERVHITAKWDGSVIEFDRPEYVNRVKPELKSTTSYKKLSDAIDLVNNLAKSNKCRLFVDGGTLKGEIVVDL